MHASKQSPSREFVYLLHAAVPAAIPQGIDTEGEDDDADELDEDAEDDGGLKEIDFDD